jgi:hypothetical protein
VTGIGRPVLSAEWLAALRFADVMQLSFVGFFYATK